jgi:uncharacterized membrane protein
MDGCVVNSLHYPWIIILMHVVFYVIYTKVPKDFPKKLDESQISNIYRA